MLGKALKLNPAENNLRILLSDAEVHLASIQSELHAGTDFSDLANRGLIGLRDLIAANPALQSAAVIDAAAQDFIEVEPASLRNPQRALSYAERAAGLSHRRKSSILLTLAKAYRATGHPEKSRDAAQEGLALLAPQSPGAPGTAIRKRLEAQLR